MSYQNPLQRRGYRPSAPSLRHSCDICNVAKVRCSKARPRCARCEARNVECVYSVSLRSVKGKAAIFQNAGRNSFNGNTTSHSQRTLSSTPTAFSNPVAPQSMIPPASEASVDGFILDGWNFNFSDVDERTAFAEPGDVDDPTINLSYIHAGKNLETGLEIGLENSLGSDHRDPLFAGLRYRDPPTALDPTSAHSFPGNSPSSVPICSCRQEILAKLSECWLAGRDTFTAFDKSLLENKMIIALCTSTLTCPDECHTDDIVLMLTIIALIHHVVTLYDQPVPDRYSSNASAAETPINSVSVISSNPSSRSSVSEELESPFLPLPPGIPLRLGSYQLDQQDEQILKVNLLRIELDKIGALIDLFERRLDRVPSGRGESKPFQEFITYLRRRLRNNQESLRS